TACLLFVVCFVMMFIGQVSMKKLALIALVCVGSVVLVLGVLKVIPEEAFKDSALDRFSTWKGRIERFSQPKVIELSADSKIPDEIFQETHSKIAIANGNIPGLPGSGVERDFLPQAYSDFIFSIILEEMGLPGGIVVILLYMALLVRAGVLASKCEKLFPRYLILGCAMMITFQAIFNMCVAVGLIPVTGQPLPLISRGGTSTIITCAYFGIMLACSNAQSEEVHEEADESIANVAYE
ncbi:MAG: FtsW/RodA/SpoVE family cell cycle protein, partial [Dysgonomonas sp.]